MARISYGDMIVLQLDNPYHEWTVRDVARRYQYPIRKIEVGSIRDIKALQYGSFMSTRELIWLVVKKPLPGLVEQLARVNTTRRLFAVELNDKSLAKAILTIQSRRLRPIALKKVKTYDDKRERLRKLLKRWGAEFDQKRTENLLLRLMIAHEESWDDVRVTLELIVRKGLVVTQKDVEELYPDDEIFRLRDWILRVLTGNTKKKSMTIADYFLEGRNYSVAWVVRKFREEVVTLSMFYQAYRRGILQVPLSSEKVKQRLDAVGWSAGYPLAELKQHEQAIYLEYVKEVDYKIFVQIEQIVFAGEEYVTSVTDLYRMFEGVRDVFYLNGKKVEKKWVRRKR